MKSTLSDAWEFLGFVVQGFRDKGCQKSAAALTYMTLFAIVPLMTVTYSMVSIIPAFQGVGEQLQGLIFDHLVPDTGQEVQEYLAAFSNQARKLTAAGVAMLVVTAYLMLNNIEKTFNTIWGVSQGRRGLSSFLIYWAILSLGPILLGLGMVMTTYLLSLRLFISTSDGLSIVPWALRLAPWVLTSAAFTLLFAAVPNCRVRLKHAFTGGVITAVVFELTKNLFSWIVSHTSFQLIYGAFAMVPLFLLWINLLWMIILAGAMFVRSLSVYKTALARRGYGDLAAALLVLWELRQRQRLGTSVGDGRLLRLGLETEQWQKIRDAFLRHRIIVITHQGDYVLSRSLDTVTLKELVKMVKMPVLEVKSGAQSGRLRQSDWYAGVSQRLASLERQIGETFDVSISELFTVEASRREGAAGNGAVETDVVETDVVEPDIIETDTVETGAVGAEQKIDELQESGQDQAEQNLTKVGTDAGAEYKDRQKQRKAQ